MLSLSPGDALDRQAEAEVFAAGLAAVRAGDGGGCDRLGRAGERDVALAREQARGGIEADPARPGQVHLGPGVQIDEVLLGAGRADHFLHVRLELHQVAGDKAGRQPVMPQ